MRKYYTFESQAQSDAEIYDELTPEQIKKIEDEAKRIFNKKDVDLEKIMTTDKKPKSDEKTDDEDDEATNEGVTILGVAAMTGLVSLILSTLGNITNLISKKTGLTLNKEQWVQYKFTKKVIKTYRQLANTGSAVLEIDGTEHTFTWKNWTEIGDLGSKHLDSLGLRQKNGQPAGRIVKSDEPIGEEEEHEVENDSELIKKKKQGYAASADIASKLKVTKNESLRYLKKFHEFILEGHGHSSTKEFAKYKITNSPSDKKFILKGLIPFINEKIEGLLPVNTVIGNALADAGHAIHEALIIPIRACIKATAWLTGWKWAYNSDNKKTLEKSFKNRTVLANIIYAGVMITYGGAMAVDKLHHLHGVKEYAGLIKETWKGTENIKEFVTNITELIPKKMS